MSYPLASSDGFLAKMPKFAVVDLVQGNWPVEETVGALPSSAVVIDAMCSIHSFLPSRLPKIFKFAACISNLITKMGIHFNASRVDLVFDTYPVISIKALEHARRHNLPQATSSLRRIISSEQQLPKQWREFLRHGPNKEELSIYLYQEIMRCNFRSTCSSHMELPVMFFILIKNLRKFRNFTVITSKPTLGCSCIPNMLLKIIQILFFPALIQTFS